MALTTAEQTAIRAIIARDGGLDAVIDEVRQLTIADKKAAALTALQSAISVTVSDWATIAAFVAQASNVTLVSVLQDIQTAAAARDASKLGPLMVQLYAAAKAHLGV